MAHRDGMARVRLEGRGVRSATRVVRFVDANRGWALSRESEADAGGNTVVLRTRDGGQHWPSATTGPLLLTTLNASVTGVVLLQGEPGASSVSTDGGGHFSAPAKGRLVFGARSGDCWRLGPSLVRQPACSGARADEVTPGSGVFFQSLDSEDGREVIVSARWQRLWNTAEWRHPETRQESEGLRTGALATGGTQAVWMTHGKSVTPSLDAGATWQAGVLPVEPSSKLESGVVPAERGLSVAVAQGHGYRSTDQGATWSRMLVVDSSEAAPMARPGPQGSAP